MSTAVKPYFNRLSANTSEDSAMAVFDIVPIDNLDASYAIPYPSSDLDFVSEDFHLFEIPSNHTRGRSCSYLMKRKNSSYIEYPVSLGIPMNYGSVPRVRFKALSSTMSDAEPFLMIPSFGFGKAIPGRAKSFEFWMNAEPYAKLTKKNVLPTSIGDLDGNVGDYVVYSGSVQKLSLTERYPSEYCDTLALGINTDVLFKDKFNLAGGREYKFSAILAATQDTNVSIQFETEGYGEYIVQTDLIGTVSEFSNQFGPEFPSPYNYYEFKFTVSETVPTTQTRMRIVTNNGAYISEPVLKDLSSIEESAVVKHLLFQTVIDGGNDVSVYIDAQYMYLTGFGNSDNFQISEWARPLYIVITDTNTNINLYINAERVMSIEKRVQEESIPFDYEFDESFGSDIGLKDSGDWIFLFLSPVLKYIDLSTISLYSVILLEDIQKIHFMFSFGPSYNNVIMNTEYQKSFVADGSATNWASRILFPVTESFDGGVANALSSGKGLALTNYQFPALLPTQTLEVADFPINVVRDIRYGPNNFTVPEGSEMHLRLLDIDIDISHIFIGVTPKSVTSATICRLQSKDSNFLCDIKIESLSTTPKTYRISAQLVYIDGTVQSPWWQTEVPDKDFVLCINTDALKLFPDIDVVGLFSNSQLTIAIIDQIPIRYISCASTSMVNANAIGVNPAVDSYGIGTVEGIDILGKSNYTVYASNEGMDIAAAGFWTVSIPLTTFAKYVHDKPDLDFILYFDQLQSPQLVSSLTKDVMTYYEMDEHVRTDLVELSGESEVGEYSDAQIRYGEDPYSSIGIEVDTSAPTLGRFIDRNIDTYVTLDSPIRWPYKDYSKLKVERATPSNFIDFGLSPSSVLDTKWEIYDGYAIRIPSDISMGKYNLKIGIHLNSKSMNIKRPVFNRLELFGIASGEFAANLISVGTGQYIVIGEGSDVNLNVPYSTHLTAEMSQSNYMHRENGFYAHFDFEKQKPIPVNFYLTDGKTLAGISFYMYWKNETFRTNGSLKDKVATIRHFLHDIDTGEDVPQYSDIGIKTLSNPTYAYQRGNVITSNSNLDIYVDGILNGFVEVGRWHLVHIDFTKPVVTPLILPPDSRVVKLSLVNDKCVVNYITSHSVAISPTNLFAARFGLTDHDIFSIRPEDGESAITVSEDAFVSTLRGATGGAEAFATLRVTYDE